ncbi:hypothetical protein [Nocardiopsis sp. CC223A]|uniref:hypothetical protein n=1 Tax=Nocardiopsis sp. CC223A TaxID=3044051 RepID=UPI00278C5929|nr:hypothetical protein [Nocardiopsis sp. CC223A]
MPNTPNTADLVDPWLELLADLGAETLPEETEDERAARESARDDILADLLDTRAVDHPTLASPMADHPDGLRSGVEEAAAAISALVTVYSDRITALTLPFEHGSAAA